MKITVKETTNFSEFYPPKSYRFNWGWIGGMYVKGHWFIRLKNGAGIGVKNIKIHSLSFSERNGLKKHYMVGKYSIKFFKKHGS